MWWVFSSLLLDDRLSITLNVWWWAHIRVYEAHAIMTFFKEYDISWRSGCDSQWKSCNLPKWKTVITCISYVCPFWDCWLHLELSQKVFWIETQLVGWLQCYFSCLDPKPLCNWAYQIWKHGVMLCTYIVELRFPMRFMKLVQVGAEKSGALPLQQIAQLCLLFTESQFAGLMARYFYLFMCVVSYSCCNCTPV